MNAMTCETSISEAQSLLTEQVPNELARLLRMLTNQTSASGSTAVISVINIPSSEPAVQASTEPTDAGDVRCSQKYKPGLERLKTLTIDHIKELVTFYLIGCSYRDGAKSLRAVSRELGELDIDGKIPKKCSVSLTELSDTIGVLESELFSVFFRKPFIRLRISSEGNSGVLSEDGWRAWEATRRYLIDFYKLPNW